MAIPIQLRRNGTAASTPSSLLHGEVALNYADGKLFWKDASNVIQSFTFQAYALSSHTHAASDITSGTLDAARLPLATTIAAGAVIVGTGLGVSSGTVSVTYGTTSGTACQGNDSRLSDTRTPTDNTVSTAKLQNDAVTYAKLQNVSATDRLLGRSSAGAGDVEEITCTAFGRSLIDDADAAAARSTLSVQPTASPAFTGTVSAAAVTLSGVLLVTAGSASAPGVAISGDTNTGIAQIGGADTLSLVTGGSERVRVDASGRVQINRTSPINEEMLHVLQASVKPGVVIKSTATSATAEPGLYIEKQDNNNTTAQKYILFAYNAGANGGGGIEGNGGTGAQFFASSDERLKENIADLAPQLANIMAMKPRVFDYISGPTGCTGFVAQELEEIYPDAVGVDANGYKTIGGISIMETRIISAIQELAARIAALEERLNHA